jgi:hypothetical protein
MITSNPNSMCEQAWSYYYYYLCRGGQEHIPAEMLAHISQCRFCQDMVNRLKVVLTESEVHASESTGQLNSAIAANLRLHFAYIGASVTCNTVRPFLPSLADPLLEVGVPSPITVHIDKCKQCAKDLEIIRQLNLTHKQLCRLGQLFAEKPFEDPISCSEAQSGILAVASMVFRETNAEVLKHLCICPDCREVLYQHRERVREELLEEQRAENMFPCEAVLAADIFDYCFSYGIDPARNQYAEFRESFTSHARSCPTCLGKMQELHRTVYGILERQESGIVTCFKVDMSALDSIVGDPDDLYEDWPIEVRVFDKSGGIETIEDRGPGIAVAHKPKQRLSTLSIRTFIKPTAVAAAVLLVAILLLKGPVAKAVDLSDVYNALEQIKNVCITTFVPGESKPTQEVWISRMLDIKMLKTNMEWVLWDIKGKSKTARDLNTNAIETTKLNEDTLVKTEEAIEGLVGLLPFDDISEVPEDAKWQQVPDENLKLTIPGTQVFDLMWTEKRLGGKIIYRKWRGYIDTETKLPKRVERWIKLTKEEYKLFTVMEVAYPATVEIQAIISDAGF